MAITKRQTLKSLCAVGALATFPTIVQAGVSTAKLKIVIKLLATGGPVRRAVTDLAGDIRRDYRRKVVQPRRVADRNCHYQ
jgi:hypothetical protein